NKMSGDPKKTAFEEEKASSETTKQTKKTKSTKAILRNTEDDVRVDTLPAA
ncbi:hypothetical protein SESBI_22969, partial [Sesbania bispinosa]